MVSKIDPSQPQTGINQPVEVIRRNFLYAKQEIEDVQSQIATIQSHPSLQRVDQDLTPKLGGDLNINNKSIISLSNQNISILPNGTGRINLDSVLWPASDGTNGQFLKTNGSGNLSWGDTPALTVISDPSPKLAANLDAQSHKIINLLTPTASTDAANKSYVDSNFIAVTAPILGNTLNAQNNAIINVVDPTNSQDAATKNYVDSVVTGFDINSYRSGTMSASLVLFKMVFVRNVNFPINMVNSRARSDVAATASTTISIRKNGSSFATMVFGAASTTATFTAPLITSFVPGDILDVIAPASPDGTLAGVHFTLLGTRF